MRRKSRQLDETAPLVKDEQESSSLVSPLGLRFQLIQQFSRSFWFVEISVPQEPMPLMVAAFSALHGVLETWKTPCCLAAWTFDGVTPDSFYCYRCEDELGDSVNLHHSGPRERFYREALARRQNGSLGLAEPFTNLLEAYANDRYTSVLIGQGVASFLQNFQEEVRAQRYEEEPLPRRGADKRIAKFEKTLNREFKDQFGVLKFSDRKPALEECPP